jgi:hypothetical protein
VVGGRVGGFVVSLVLAVSSVEIGDDVIAGNFVVVVVYTSGARVSILEINEGGRVVITGSSVSDNVGVSVVVISLAIFTTGCFVVLGGFVVLGCFVVLGGFVGFTTGALVVITREGAFIIVDCFAISTTGALVPIFENSCPVAVCVNANTVFWSCAIVVTGKESLASGGDVASPDEATVTIVGCSRCVGALVVTLEGALVTLVLGRCVGATKLSLNRHCPM